MDILAGGVIVNISIISLFNQIVPQYFSELSSLAIVLDDKPSSDIYWEYADGLKIFFKYQANPPISWISINKSMDNGLLKEKIHSVVELGSHGYIVATPRVVDFITLRYQVIHKSLQRRRNEYFVFLLDDPDDDITNEILHHEAMKLFPSHIIVKKSKRNGFDLITQKFVSNYDNEKGILLDILQEDGSFKENAELFPDKLNNFQGKDIPMGTHTFIPYSIIESASDGEGNVDELGEEQPNTLFLDGAEAIMMFEFSRLRNFTIKMKKFGHDDWGTIYENDTGNGLLASIYRKEVDFAFGCVSMWYYNRMDYSHVTAKSTVILLVPAAEVLPPSLTPILPFTWHLWLAVALTVIIDVIVYYFLEWHTLKNSSKRASMGSATLIVGAIYLQQCIPETKKPSSVRSLVAILLLSSVILGNSYGGALSSVLTVPKYGDSIDTIHKFAESGLKWGTPSIVWIYTIMRAEEPDYQTIVKNFEEKTAEELRELSFTKKFAFGIEKITSGGYGPGYYIKADVLDNFEMLRHVLHYEWSTPNSVRGWPLMEYFNTHVLQVLQHGLFDFWERRIVEKYFNIKTEIALKLLSTGYRPNPGITRLKVAHISGPLILLAFGLSLATLVFLIELIIARLKGKPEPIY